jgi:hypothetical protein
MDIIKEYFTANFRLNLLNKQAVIVVPDLDNPGKVANPWHIPIKNALE